uniref:Uncharacterized protein n=1 Tax=Glossina palpalis gambiensis TaxID=67801 RepID=A0A1B0BKV7_9MUSC
MAKKNVKESIKASIDRAIKLIAKGNECFAGLIVLDVNEQKPHFAYLSELWTTLELHLAHIAEIIKIKDHLDELVSENLERNYIENLEATIRGSKSIKFPIEPTFSELMELTNKYEGQLNLMKLVRCPYAFSPVSNVSMTRIYYAFYGKIV